MSRSLRDMYPVSISPLRKRPEKDLENPPGQIINKIGCGCGVIHLAGLAEVTEKIELPPPDTASLALSGRSVDYINGYEAGYERASDVLVQRRG